MSKTILTPEEIDSLLMGELPNDKGETTSLPPFNRPDKTFRKIRTPGHKKDPGGHSEAAEERLIRDAFDTINEAMIITDANGTILFENGPFRDLFNSPQNDLRHKAFDREIVLLSGPEQKPIDDPVRQTLREGRPVHIPMGTWIVRPDGSMVPVVGSAMPIRRNGEIQGAIFCFHLASLRKGA